MPEQPTKLFETIRKLEESNVYFRVGRQRAEAVTLFCTLVGLRIEIDVFEDGHLEFSTFKGDESVESEEQILWDLVARNS